jgi:hypothetical protein
MDAFPRAVKVSSQNPLEANVQLGLVSAPTPFVTGRPHTLFHAGQTYGVGSVGLVLTHAPKPTVEAEYGVEAIDREYVVES